MNNEQIAEKIRQARKERGFTQAQLAELLNRTVSNISDIERNRVQVSAVDLYLIAKYLTKPIDYFFGDEFNENDIQDLIAFIRKQPPEVRKDSIQTTKMLLSMQQMGDKFLGNNKEPTIEEMQEFFSSFINYVKQINEINDKVNGIRDVVIKSLKDQGIDLMGVK